MKMSIKGLCIIIMLSSSGLLHSDSTIVLPPDAQLVDAINVVIYSEDGCDIITKSDVDRPGIDGSFRSLDDIIFERLVYLDAKKFKMMSDDEMIDRHLKAIQKENNMTLDQLKQVFKAAGYTYKEGREQFAVMTTVSMMLETRIRSRLIVPEKDIQTYFNEHPIIEPASYLLQRAEIAIPAGFTSQEFEQELATFVRGDCDMNIPWGDPFWITKDELAENKMFITTMKPGEIASPTETAKGFELIRVQKVQEAKTVPLEQRYREIANQLRKPRFDALMEEYKKLLFDTAVIVRF